MGPGSWDITKLDGQHDQVARTPTPHLHQPLPIRANNNRKRAGYTENSQNTVLRPDSYLLSLINDECVMLSASARLPLPRLHDLPSSKAASRSCKQTANVGPGCMPVKKVLFVVTVSPEDTWEPKGDTGLYRGSIDAREASGRYGGAQHCRLFGFIC